MAYRILCVLLLLCPAIAWTQNSCSPPALGHPCTPGGLATQGPLEPELSLGIGNPVHLGTGNKHQQELDLPGSPSWPLLQVLRHYNSLDPRHGPFGRGWRSSYDTRLYRQAGRIQIAQADGSRIDFGVDSGRPLRSHHGLLRFERGQWTWTWPDGHRLSFDLHGRLTRIAAPHTDRGLSVVDIVRHAQPGPLYGAIEQVAARDASNTPSILLFHYQTSGARHYVRAIDTPLGRFNYVYEKAGLEPSVLRLTAVRRPDGYERRYRYDSARQSNQPQLVTGIALAAPHGAIVPIHDWAYDAYGRATSSWRHFPAQHAYALTIHYARPASPGQNGVTLVVGADGRRTRFEFNVLAGRYKVIKVDGAPCPGCPAPDSAVRYDAKGRLEALNGSRFQRHPAGQLAQLMPDAPGWPGLQFDFNTEGLRTGWHTAITGTENTVFDELGRPIQRLFSNGDEWRYRYDAQGRPTRITARNANATILTRLTWSGPRLTSVRHPSENETRRYDKLGRLTSKRVQRAGIPIPGAHHEYVDRFEYDKQHRLAMHHLPEGGSLHYDWNKEGQLMRIVWRDKHGGMHNVIQAWPAQSGYRYGNGLRMALHLQHGSARALALHDGNTVIWDHFRVPDAHARPVRESNRFAAPGLSKSWSHSYTYDAKSRLATSTALPLAGRWNTGGDAEPVASPRWHAWHPDGSAAAVKQHSHTDRPRLERDASGLPRSIGGFDVQYSPQRRLQQVRRHNTTLDEYQHNAYGHRIFARTPRDQTQFFYLDNRLVAEARQSRLPDSRPQSLAITRRYIHADHAMVGIIEYSHDAPAGVLYAVHADLMGAPHLITDSNRRIRWLARYTPFGSARRIAGDLELHLRLPGQILDTTTGWHDNLLRTYDPHFGHYLEPDPLGPLPGTQAMGYAAQQPRRYVDPMGLLLFAFDGTRQNARTRSNVWLLSQRYQDGPTYYHSGPGNPHYLDLDAVAAHTAPQIIDTQWQHLLNALHGAPPLADEPVPIDIIGYSRGAALARHFGNLIEQHVSNGLFSYADPLRGQISTCVDLRFMGLFDTVAQFGVGGSLNSLYDFSISAAWGWVAHAVALHERRWLFPLVTASQGMADNVVEAPFIGAHGNIGGGVSQIDQGSAHQGDLSDVALNWMLWQARAAAVPLAALAAEHATVSDPILHDQRSSLARSTQEGDRRVDTPDGNKLLDYQDHHHRLGREQRDATEALIQRYENWRRNDSVAVGTVDLDAYARWLYGELGWHTAPPQATWGANQAII